MEHEPKEDQPSTAHRRLARLVGEWVGEARVAASAGPPITSQVASRHTWVLGDRFLRMELTGLGGARGLEALGFLGHDNAAQEYTFVWLETATTAMEVRRGTFDGAATTLSLWGETLDPASRERRRSVLRYCFGGNPDSFSLEIAEVRETGQEARVFSIAYARRR